MITWLLIVTLTKGETLTVVLDRDLANPTDFESSS